MNTPPVSCQAVGDRIRVAMAWRDGTSVTTTTISTDQGRALLAELSQAVTAATTAASRRALEAAGQQSIGL